ncbi:signal transduction histidine kinase [Bradyrhizobium sp. F1.13.4]
MQLPFSLNPDADLVLADRVQIQQVLVNMFRNAREAMAQSPRRELVVTNNRIADDMIKVKVSDTGSGFREDVTPNLFQTFFTTQRDRHSRGTVHQPLDHRGSRRPHVGREQRIGRGNIPLRLAGSRRELIHDDKSNIYVIDDDEAMRESLNFVLILPASTSRCSTRRRARSMPCPASPSAAWSPTCACRTWTESSFSSA